MASRAVKLQRVPSPLITKAPVPNQSIELQDHGLVRRSAVEFFGLAGLRDQNTIAGRMAEQFITQNQNVLRLMDARAETFYDGNTVSIQVHAGSAVGAVPLVSPTSRKPDFGLFIQPRFSWSGVGLMLAEMGWRITPVPLRLPMLKRSERRVPLWVLSSMVLVRLEALLETLNRRFELVREDRNAPRGRVDWGLYAGIRIAHGKMLSIPCTFPDLRDDRQLKGAIRYAIEKQMTTLESQKTAGAYVHRLLEYAGYLHQKVRAFSIYMPARDVMDRWLSRGMQTVKYLDGIQGIEWTVEERGLAGTSDLEGIPWRMPMDNFFEAWVETLLVKVAAATGSRLKVGRRRETVHAIDWTPSYVGSQRALVPDFLMEVGNVTLIVDAKYKRHWEELEKSGWAGVDEELRERHRNDLLQVLAYGNLSEKSRIVTCLVYPCSLETWESLKERRRLLHRAEISVGTRSVGLWLTAVPMSAELDQATALLIEQVRSLRDTIE